MTELAETRNWMPDAERLAAIRAAIDEYNAERPGHAAALGWRIPVIAGGYLVAAGLVLYLAFGIPQLIYIALCAGAAAGLVGAWKLAHEPSRNFQQDLRHRLFPVIFGFIEKVRYEQGMEPRFLDLFKEIKMIPVTSATTDDRIRGRQDGLDFEMAEVALSVGSGKSSQVAFRGIIFHFRRLTPFPGVLLAQARANVIDRFLRDLFGGHYKQVSCGNAAIDRAYEFHTDNDAAARALINSQMAKALDWLQSAWSEGTTQIALSQHDCFLLLPTQKNYFELPDIALPTDFDAHILPMIREMVTLLAIAHLLAKLE